MINEENKTVAVIGGGAAGMAAAVRAAEMGASVVLYERNDKLGRKLGITGKGRCNVTNNCTPNEFLSNVTKNNKFLYSAAFRHTPADVMAFFEGEGVSLKTERGGRVFPVSDRASDIVNALRFALKDRGVKTVYPYRVKSITQTENGFEISDGKTSHTHTAVVICTGGKSYTKTGSDGDGYKLAEKFGLKVTDIMPSLIPIDTEDNTEELAGLTLKNVTLTVSKNGKTVFSELGEMLFTHTGVSGPLVLSASAHMRDGSISDYKMEIDLKPGIPKDELDTKLINLFRDGATKDFINATAHLLPMKLVKLVADAAGIDERIKAGDVTKEMRLRYGETLKAFPMRPASMRPIEEAIITSGGIDVKEIDPKTMEAKSVPGLFFAGEILDVDAYTGGYNLQIAFSTGFSAGEAAAECVIY